jgi:vanillate O-demethylase monooxygenase subunit
MPYHGLRFDSGGRCVHNPHGDGTIPRAAKVNAYAVAERYGALWVWMGTADTADAALIPDLSEIGKREGWNVIHGTLKVPAHYELLTDNLLDLSHVAYLHPFLTFSGPLAEGYREERPMQQQGDTVWSMHKMLNAPINPLFGMLWDGAPEIIDMRGHMRWNAPANLFLDVGVSPANRPVTEGVWLPTAHLLTPETGTSTHYFWAQARNVKLDDPELDQQLWHGIDGALRTEDEPMEVACQQMMGTSDLMSLKPVLLEGDAPAVRVRRILAEQLKQQSGANERRIATA